MKLYHVTDRPITNSHRTGTIYSSLEELKNIIPEECIVRDDSNKVTYSVVFTDGSRIAAIWDYKGSYEYNEFSSYGDQLLLSEIQELIMKGKYNDESRK
jgi:hypothetical protein